MASIPLEIIYLIARYIEPNPVTYLRLAGISRMFYHVFMADQLWGRLNFAGSPNSISRHFVAGALSWTPKQRAELVYCWSLFNIGRPVSGLSTSDSLFGAIVNGLNVFPPPLVQDPTFMSALLDLYPGSFRYASDALKDDYGLALKAVACNRYALSYVSDRLRSNIEICRAAIRFDPWCLDQAPDHIQANREIVLEAVKIDGRSLRFASKDLQNCEHVVRVAIAQNGAAIKFASERLRGDFALALRALEQNCWGWLGISSELQYDHCAIETALSRTSPQDWQLVEEITCRAGVRSAQSRALQVSAQRAVPPVNSGG